MGVGLEYSGCCTLGAKGVWPGADGAAVDWVGAELLEAEPVVEPEAAGMLEW